MYVRDSKNSKGKGKILNFSVPQMLIKTPAMGYCLGISYVEVQGTALILLIMLLLVLLGTCPPARSMWSPNKLLFIEPEPKLTGKHQQDDKFSG